MGEIIDRFERDGCKDPVAFHEDNRLPIRAVCLKVIDDLSRQKRIVGLLRKNVERKRII